MFRTQQPVDDFWAARNPGIPPMRFVSNVSFVSLVSFVSQRELVHNKGESIGVMSPIPEMIS